jgi:ERCC4-type nuclease
MITIDTNAGENPLFEKLKRELGAAAVERRRLDVGDVQIVAEGGEAIIVERKTWLDLASSLRDGRYHSQKARMSGAAEAGATVVFIVEGGVRGWHGTTTAGGLSVNNAQLEAAIVKTLIRDRMPVLRSASTDHTAAIVSYLSKELTAGRLQAEATAYEGFTRKRKRDLDGASTFTYLLSCVPGMSAAKAKAVSERYGNFRELAAAGEKELAQIQVRTDEKSAAGAEKKPRRLGPAAAARLASL